MSSPALTATYIRGLPGGPCYLAISMQGIVADNASRDILLTDIFTAFAQRLAGEDIALQPVTTPWTEWSQRCAALATHPAVVESRDFWLKTTAKATLRVASSEVSEPPGADDLKRLSTTLSVLETPRSTTCGAGFGCRSTKSAGRTGPNDRRHGRRWWRRR